QLVVERGGRRERYGHGTAGFSGGTAEEGTLRGEAVFCGYGIAARELGYDDFAGVDVRGRIVLVFDHEPQEDDPKSRFNGTGATRHSASRVKALEAQRRGALALLVAAEPNRKHPSNAERRARIAGGEQRARRIASQQIEGDALRIPVLTVSDALAQDLLAGEGKKLQAAIDREGALASKTLGAAVEIRLLNRERRRGSTANVLAVLEGSDAALRSETIVFSAHHDHDGRADGGVFAGADDNGSGTVGVVELARAFARDPVRPRRSVLFAVFGAEERGLLGSYYYVDHPLRAVESTRAAINFDMIGRNETASRQTDGLIEIDADTSNELNLIGTIHSPDYRDVVETVNRDIGLTLNYKWDRDTVLNIFQRSDQFPFALRDVPAVWWFTGFHPDYHQTSDTAEKINYAKMEKIVRLAYRAGRAMADAKAAPRFVAAPVR
ncbi:MAG: M20/M25/M40 family metallo-hydrolase, partial [Bryobacteraceae bacterium]